MLILQFILYFSSFDGTLKNEISGTALERYQLKTKQFSSDILKFSTKCKDNSFTLNCSIVSSTFLFIFYAGSHRLGSNNFWHSSYKQKNDRLGPCFKIIFPFHMTMNKIKDTKKLKISSFCTSGSVGERFYHWIMSARSYFKTVDNESLFAVVLHTLWRWSV